MADKNIYNIILNNDFGKQWTEEGGSFVKGYAFKDDKLYEGKELINLLIESISIGYVKEILLLMNGTFSAIIRTGDNVHLISDKVRSYPLIFAKIPGNKWIISDTAIPVIEHLSNFKNVNLSTTEFYTLGYVSGANTLFENVYTIGTAQYIELKENMRFSRCIYHQYIYEKTELSKDNIIENAYNALETAFQRLIKTLPDDSQIVIPLSGGYDSRLIACLCKKYDLRNVVCYTYGRKDSFEVSTSRKVAEILGFEWHSVEYTSETLLEALCSSEFKKFTDFSSNCEALPHMQEFLPLKNLLEKGIISNNAIVIPGFCGDLFGGSKIPKEVFNWKDKKFTSKNFASLIFNHFYDLNIPKYSYKKQILLKIQHGVEEYEISTEDSFLNQYEQWCIDNRLAKYIINALRVYEFYGLDWRIPLWDDEYAEVWYRVPWNKKTAELLEEFMFTKYFLPFKLDFRKSQGAIASHKNFITVARTVIPESIWRIVRQIYALTYQWDSKNDVNCFRETAQRLSSTLSFIGARSGIRKWRKSNLLAVLTKWVLGIIENE